MKGYGRPWLQPAGLLALTLALSACGSSSGDSQNEERYVPPSGNGSSVNYLEYQGKQVYLNGANIAWLSFAQDFGQGLDETTFNHILDQLVAAGGNSLRWWVHVNGSASPIWDENSQLVADATSQQAVIDDIKRALDLAQAKGVYLMPCLWSFDMLAITQQGVDAVAERNYAILSEAQTRQSYIDNFLLPLIEQTAGHPALIAIDLFNEPENMTEQWFIDRESLPGSLVPAINDIHTTTALFSAAIHQRADELGEEILVTTGPKSLGLYNTDGFGGNNYYSDERMINLGGEDAPLDFYAPHYYDDMQKEGAWSPYHHMASYWELDKPVVLGEFFATDQAYKPGVHDFFGDEVGLAELCPRLESNGYAGGFPWQWANANYRESVFDCIRAVSGNEPSDPEQSLSFDFADGQLPFGFAASSNTGAAGALSISDQVSLVGDYSLALNFSEDAGEKKVYLSLPMPTEAKMASLSAQVWVPQSLVDSGLNIAKAYAKAGSSWTWSSTADISLKGDSWNPIVWIPDSPIESLQELGLQFYAGEQSAAISDGSVYIDDVQIAAEQSDSGPSEPEPQVRFDFEGLDAVPAVLSAISWSGGSGALSLSEGQGSDASTALLARFDEASGEKKIVLYIQEASQQSLSALSMTVRLSEQAIAAGISGGKLFAQTGAGWDYQSGEWISLEDNQWHSISWQPDTALEDVQAFGLELYAGNGVASAEIDVYIDDLDY
ncbi:cellulase family glycosylhydrolase [Aliagarivorans taiwanensis]|uniref:cellulase family glycosylhydrolase n=1 Tax=Aliagarivorans taiwanensis TaxID=561966 RepID=UPI000410ABC7|nr:cellulase family glycosylhydrolase [Aliagarivorans taiwanensis]